MILLKLNGMQINRVLKLFVLMLILAESIFVNSIYVVNTEPDIIYVPDHYPKIQDAIDAANENDTIIVRSGTYNEPITVDKRLTIQGEDKTSTIIDGMKNWAVVLINAKGVVFSGFTVINGSEGIYLDNADGATVSDCIVYNCTYEGICSSSNWVSIINCSSYGNGGAGIILSSCDNNQILRCDTYNNGADGIFLWCSDRAKIEDCTSYNNSVYGVHLSYADATWIVGCNCHNNSDDGFYLYYSDIVSICSSTSNNNKRDGLDAYHSYKLYASRSYFYDNSLYGVYLWMGSNGVIVNSDVTGHDLDGIYVSVSELRIRYCRIEDNTHGVSCFSGNVDARESWWGDASGPYHPSLNPTGTGNSVSDDVEFDPWQIEPYQPDALISDLRCQLGEEWRVVYPDQETPKPLGCGAAWVSDWLASAFVTTKLEDYVEGLDTDDAFVDQSAGKAVGDPGIGILTFGGQFVNPVVKRAESDGTPDADRAPVKFYLDGTTFRFQYKNGTNIPGAWLPQSVINVDEDLFLIERYLDGDGRHMMICYGFGWPGTYAAGKFFDSVVFEHLGLFTDGWIIVHWEDTNEDGFVNNPGEGDTYTLIARGS